MLDYSIRPRSPEKYGVSFGSIEETDLEMIRNWRNAPEIRRYMANRDLISVEQHQQWFRGLKGDRSREYCLVYFQGAPIGVSNLVKIDHSQGTAEGGIYIYTETYRKSWIPFAAAVYGNEMAFLNHDLKNIDIYIDKANSAAIRYNKKMGFKEVDSDESYIYMRLSKTDFLINKKKIEQIIEIMLNV